VRLSFKVGHGLSPPVFRLAPASGRCETSNPSNSAVRGLVELLIAETPTFIRSLSSAVRVGNEVQRTPSGPKDAFISSPRRLSRRRFELSPFYMPLVAICRIRFHIPDKLR
jgi:hypothetical protein